MEILLNELNEIQETEGYISEKEMLRVSKKYDIPKAELYGIITFYSRLYTEPTPKYIIRICKSVSCGMNGSKRIIKTIEEYIGKNKLENEFLVEEVECLGHCGEGPVISINDKIYDKMTDEKVENILKNYKEGELK